MNNDQGYVNVTLIRTVLLLLIMMCQNYMGSGGTLPVYNWGLGAFKTPSQTSVLVFFTYSYSVTHDVTLTLS